MTKGTPDFYRALRRGVLERADDPPRIELVRRDAQYAIEQGGGTDRDKQLCLVQHHPQNGAIVAHVPGRFVSRVETFCNGRGYGQISVIPLAGTVGAGT